MTTPIITRAGKGSALTHEELDANLTNLQSSVDSPLITGSLSSGMISGGIITQTAGQTTQIDISAGTGVIVDNTTDPLNPVLTQVNVSEIGLELTNITTQGQTHILLMPDGQIDQRETPPTASARRNCIYLGQVGHNNQASIEGILPRPDVFASPMAQLRDLMYALGAINRGVTISAGGANLTISRNAGEVFLEGANVATNPLQPHLVDMPLENPKLLRLRTQNASNGDSNNLDPTNYDVGGVVTAISGNRYSNQRAYQFGNGNLLIQYGQVTYNSLALAVEAISTESFTPNPATATAAVLVGVISVRDTATDLSDPAQAQFTTPSMFGRA